MSIAIPVGVSGALESGVTLIVGSKGTRSRPVIPKVVPHWLGGNGDSKLYPGGS